MAKKKRHNDGLYQRGQGKQKTWWMDCRINGTRYQLKIGKGISRTVAGEIAQVKRAGILRGEVGIGKKRKDLPFEKAAELFLEWVQSNRRPKTHQAYKEGFDQLEKAFSGKKLSEISPFLLEKYKIKRKSEKAQIAANRELAYLSSMYNRLMVLKRYEGENPVSKVEKFEESDGVHRYLSPEEFQALVANASDPCKSLVLVAVYTGLRVKSEILTLKKGNVHLKQRYLVVESAYAKNGQTRKVPLNPEVVDALERQMERSESEWVFVKDDNTTRLKDIRTAFKAACRRAKITDLRIHDLRHTFATWMVQQGVDLRRVQKIGGWSKLDMVQRYSNPHYEDLVEAVDQLPTIFTTPARSNIVELPQVAENK